MKQMFLGIAALLLTGCSGNNSGLSTLQMNWSSVPFPQNYQWEAVRVVRERGGDPQTATVSRPARVVGMNALSPQRWYSCILGLPPSRKVSRLPKATELIDQIVDPESAAGVFNVILFYSGRGSQPAIREGYDSALCRTVQYEPIIDPPPSVKWSSIRWTLGCIDIQDSVLV